MTTGAWPFIAAIIKAVTPIWWNRTGKEGRRKTKKERKRKRSGGPPEEVRRKFASDIHLTEQGDTVEELSLI